MKKAEKGKEPKHKKWKRKVNNRNLLLANNVEEGKGTERNHRNREKGNKKTRKM